VFLFKAIDASASGLTAQRLRLDLIADNIANISTTRTAEGGPYRRRVPVFVPQNNGALSFQTELNRALEWGSGGPRVAAVIEDPRPGPLNYDPSHPDARADGFVEMPNVNVVTEMSNMIAATRAYDANVTVMNAAKDIAQRALEIGRG